MDEKVKREKTLPAPHFQKTEHVKKNIPSNPSRISSSVTHPSATMSSRRFSAVSFLLENNDIIQKIPSHIDPNMFSDDEEDDEYSNVEEDVLDEEAEEENSGLAYYSVDSNESRLQASASKMPEKSSVVKEFHSNSAFRAAVPVNSTHSAVVTSVERVNTQKENRLQQNADFRSHTKYSGMPEATSSRVKTQNENRLHHSADFRSHNAKHSLKFESGPSRSLQKKEQDTIEDFNWRKKANKPTSHQVGSLIKLQQPVMEKIDELPNKSSDKKISSKSSEGCTGSSLSNTLEKAKSHEDLCPQEGNVPHTSKQSQSAGPHSFAKQVACVPAAKEKPVPCISRETLKSHENRWASQESYSKADSDRNKKLGMDLVIPDGVVTVNNKPYLILGTLGSGGSCKVYSGYDARTESVYAIKCVNLGSGDKQIIDGYKQEIEYLIKLKGSSRVIKMFDYEYLESEIRILLEKGDTDFAHYIANEMKIKPLSPIMIKFYWSQMLEAVAEIHKLGIVHSDLKPANFLLVAGQLKLIDFGIATSVPPDMTSAIRESQVGTLNFMSPEAITTHYTGNDDQNYIIKVGVKSDVWSLGCILYNLVYGYTPFSSINRMLPKIRAIIDVKHEIPFPPIEDQLLLDVLKHCLKRNPKERASVEELLKHPYLTSEAKNEVPGTPVKSNIEFQDMLTQLESLTPNRMSVVSKVLQKMQSVKKQ